MGHYLLKGETKCEVSLSKRQCRLFAKLRGFQFSLSGQNYNNPEGQDAKFQQNIPTLPSGCYINEGTVEWNRNDNAHTCYNTHSDDDSSTIACVCAVPVPSSACSLNCPETKLEQISLDGDCGDGDLDDSNRQEFLIPNTPTHPGTLEGARGMCAKFCSKLEKQSWEREKCKYFSVSSNSIDGAEDKCYQEFLPDDCLSYEQNTNSKQTYKFNVIPLSVLFLSVPPLMSDIASKSGILSGSNFILEMRSSRPSGPDISLRAGLEVLSGFGAELPPRPIIAARGLGAEPPPPIIAARGLAG